MSSIVNTKTGKFYKEFISFAKDMGTFAKHSIQFAGFPYYKTFEDFDFSFQPSLNKEEILDFKNLRFIEKAENILFVGSPRSRKNTFINKYRNSKCNIGQTFTSFSYYKYNRKFVSIER